MSYSYDKFLRSIQTTDKNIQIIDNTGIVKYTINPFSIVNVMISNNLLKINMKQSRTILINFSSTNEAKLAISKLQEQIDILTEKTPLFIDKQIANYVDDRINSVLSGVGGTLSNTLQWHGNSYDFIATEFDNIVFTSSVFDVVAEFISLDSTDSMQILADYDIDINAGGNLYLSGESGLISIENQQGLVYNGDYSGSFSQHSLVDKNYVDNLLNTTFDVSSGIDNTIYSGFLKNIYHIHGARINANGQTYSSWRLFANVPLYSTQTYFDVTKNVYVKYIGKIIIPIEYPDIDISLSSQQNSIIAFDQNFGKVISHFGPGGLVTNETGIANPISYACLMMDNSLLSNEYEIWVLAGNDSDFEAIVSIDVSINTLDGIELIFDKN